MRQQKHLSNSGYQNSISPILSMHDQTFAFKKLRDSYRQVELQNNTVSNKSGGKDTLLKSYSYLREPLLSPEKKNSSIAINIYDDIRLQPIEMSMSFPPSLPPQHEFRVEKSPSIFIQRFTHIDKLLNEINTKIDVLRKEQVESVKFPMIVWNSQDENSPINVVIDENKADYNPIHQISKMFLEVTKQMRLLLSTPLTDMDQSGDGSIPEDINQIKSNTKESIELRLEMAFEKLVKVQKDKRKKINALNDMITRTYGWKVDTDLANNDKSEGGTREKYCFDFLLNIDDDQNNTTFALLDPSRQKEFEERAREIHQIEREMSSIIEILHNFQMLTGQQASKIAQIDQGVDETSNYVESGRKQLEQADKKQKTSQRYQIILIVGLSSIFFVLFVLILNR